MAKPLESNTISEDVQMSSPRDKTIISSTNISRELSMLSKVSSIEYLTHIEAQSNDSNWANQTDEELFRLSYVIPLKGNTNINSQTTHWDNVPLPHVGYVQTTPPLVPAINSSVLSLSYNLCQPGNPKSRNSCTNPISMFSQTLS